MGRVLDARVGLGNAVRTARAALGGSVLVLTYHRVANLPDDPYALAIEPHIFEEQIAVLDREHSVLHAPELCCLLARRRRLPSRAVVVTFDDGYADLLTVVKPVLERYAIPATAFISTAELGTERERWWDEIAFLCSARHDLPDRVTFTSAGATFEHDVEPGDAGRDTLRLALLENLICRDSAARDEVLTALFESFGIERPQRPEYRSLTAAEVRELGDGGLIEIGSHTANHQKLVALSPDAQAAEIGEGKRVLEEVLDRPVDLFSYPHGGRDAIGPMTPDLVRDAGFSCAFANWFGLTFPWTDRFTIPRCPTEGLDGDAFDARLRQWLAMGR